MRSYPAVGRFRVERSIAFEVAIVLAVCAGVLGASLLILTGLDVVAILAIVAVAYVVAFAVVVATAT
jgi:hypothetical protein